MSESEMNRGEQQRVSTGLSLNDFLKQYQSQQEQERARIAKQSLQPRQTPRTVDAYNRSRYYPSQEAMAPHHRKRLTKGQKWLAGIAVASVGLVGAYAGNVGNIQNVFSPNDGTVANGYAMAPPATLGESSLAANQCETPSAALMAITVSGYADLVPDLTTATHSTPIDVAPYMNKASEEKLPADQQAEFSKFITKDGYTHANLINLPLAVFICEPTGKAAVTEQGGAITVNRSDLQISVKDPATEFQAAINAVPQTNEATTSTNPNAGQYMTIPNPAHNMFLGNSSDTTFNTSLANLVKSMQTSGQLQALLADMETQAVQEIDSVVGNQQDISYPGGAKTFQQALDSALIQRLVGKTTKTPVFEGNYTVNMIVPTDPTTKAPITSTALQGLDTSKFIFHITDAKVADGSLKAPPSPTPTAAPTPTESTPAPTPSN